MVKLGNESATVGVANVLTLLATTFLVGMLLLPSPSPLPQKGPSAALAPGPVLAFDDFEPQPALPDSEGSTVVDPPYEIASQSPVTEAIGGAPAVADATADQPPVPEPPPSSVLTDQPPEAPFPRPPQTQMGGTTASSSTPALSNPRPPSTAPLTTGAPTTAAMASTTAPATIAATTSVPSPSPSATPSTVPVPPSGKPAETLQWAARWGDDPGVRGQIDSWIKGPIILASDFDVVADDGRDDFAGIRAALDAASGGGVVVLPSGVLEASATLALSSGQILRGAGSSSTQLIFTQSMDWGIELGGEYSQVDGVVVTAVQGATSITVRTAKPPVVGNYAILQAGPGRPKNAGEIVRIMGADPSGSDWILTVEQPLSQSLAGAEYLPFEAGEGIGVEHLSVQPAPGVSVDYHFVLRGTANSWVRNVESRLARRAHVYSRQTSSCEIRNNTFSDARYHGDGGMGYGVNLANRTTGCLVLQNRLSLLRHSMLLHDGATRNVVAYNHSSDPRHPNFVDGGPADMSFHGVATANLVEGNIVSRVQLTDAGVAGAHNTILRNCVTSGPPTIRNEPTDAWLIGNSILGSNAAVKATIMPAVDWSAERPYTTSDLFDADGILVQGAAPGLLISGNWFAGQVSGDAGSIPKSAIRTAAEVPTVPTGAASTDCPYAPS